MTEATGKSEAEVFSQNGEWVVLVWDEREDGEWMFAGRASTERSLRETVRRLKREGWEKVRVLGEDGRLWWED